MTPLIQRSLSLGTSQSLLCQKVSPYPYSSQNELQHLQITPQAFGNSSEATWPEIRGRGLGEAPLDPPVLCSMIAGGWVSSSSLGHSSSGGAGWGPPSPQSPKKKFLFQLCLFLPDSCSIFHPGTFRKRQKIASLQ